MNNDRTDLCVEVFLSLRNRFFDADSVPKPYTLRDKRNTQDDPLDEFICAGLEADLGDEIHVAKATGPLITPDMVVYRPLACDHTPRAKLRSDSSRIFGLEVKKLERQPSGAVARATGLDYNTTPPCGTVRVYDSSSNVLDIKGFYLFVCQETVSETSQSHQLTALALCDGNLLNEDFEYYISIVSRRSKEIGLGTYGDGANRVRPMVIFSNPLGAPFLDQRSTLIDARDNLQASHPTLYCVGTIERSVPTASGQQSERRKFHCYRDRQDVIFSAHPSQSTTETDLFHESDPFPTPRRSEATATRGRFVVRVSPSD